MYSRTSNLYISSRKEAETREVEAASQAPDVAATTVCLYFDRRLLNREGLALAVVAHAPGVESLRSEWRRVGRARVRLPEPEAVVLLNLGGAVLAELSSQTRFMSFGEAFAPRPVVGMAEPEDPGEIVGAL